MKIIFLGLMYLKDKERELLQQSKIGLPNACNIYQWNVIDGMIKNGHKDIQIINSLPVGNYPFLFSKLYLKSKKWIESGVKGHEIGTLNFYFIKHLIREVKVYCEIEKILKEHGSEPVCIMAYDIYLPFLKVMQKIKRRNKNVITCSIITDLPGALGYQKSKNKIINKFLDNRAKKEMLAIKNIDKYVFLTEHMKNLLNCEEKEFVIIEGMSNLNSVKKTLIQKKSDKRIIFYAGGLYKQYGLDILLEAFSKIEDEKYELWLCGQGDMTNEIKKSADLDCRIKFFGYISKEEVLELEQKITVYINTRKNTGEYTKYSFPSKTIEYLNSGKPVLSYKLDGIPKEYDDYIQYISGETADELKESIVKLCKLNNYELSEIGNKGRIFIENKKNNIIQSKKILDMIHGFI